MPTEKILTLFGDITGLQADVLIKGITETRRNRMYKLLKKFFAAIGADVPEEDYWMYWYEA